MISAKNTLGNLTEYAEMLSNEVNKKNTLIEKKEKGQYFTSASIAKLMANMLVLNKSHIKLLDPGSGTGILTAAICDRIISEKLSVTIHVDLFEMDCLVIPYLHKLLEACKKSMEENGSEFAYNIIQEDFILSHASLFDENGMLQENGENYDFIISNPPYFKVKKQHIYSEILHEYVHGQPNIYFMFMAVAKKLLKFNGQMVFITPRSYTSGAYFEKFRRRFFEVMDTNQIHIFESRKNNFTSEKVLQENIILSAFKRISDDSPVVISSSSGNIEETYTSQEVDRKLIFDTVFDELIIRIPITPYEQKVVRLFDDWANSLSTLNMEISTGPVVTFRSKDIIDPIFMEKLHYPLIYMQHLRNNEVVFPIVGKKNEGIRKDVTDEKLLLPTRNYVLLKRFTSKEQKRRVDASILLEEKFHYRKVGLENHLNYIYRPNGTLSIQETAGICAFLNSKIVDTYFRVVNGNTQVNASDIRSLPLPNHAFILWLGSQVLDKKIEINSIDNILEREFLSVSNKIQEAMDILTALELPPRQRNERSALTLLALLDITKNESWDNSNNPTLRIHDIMKFIADEYGKTYAENSRETFRRQTIHQFEQAAIVVRNPDDPTRPTNSGKTVYAVSEEALNLFRKYNSSHWDDALQEFLEVHKSLSEKYGMIKKTYRVPIILPNGKEFLLSPGKHNILQKAILEEFRYHFGKNTEILYIGDTENKHGVHTEEQRLMELNIPVANHDKLPDVVLYDGEKDWVYLIEAVTSHGPVSRTRLMQLEDMLKYSNSGRIYVSAFLDMREYKKHATEIAWDTEVWFADQPNHMLHLNGDMFIGPRDRKNNP